MSKKIQKNRAFSLIEMIIVIMISSVIALAVSQIFLSSTKNFERSKEASKNLEEARSAMEIITKNLRMSKFVDPQSVSNRTITFLNTSLRQCMSYKFDTTDNTLKYATCVPKLDGDVPVGSTGSSTDTDICQEGQCSGGAAYSYNTLINQKVTGYFDVIKSSRITTPMKIGRAVITMTVGDGTENEQTIQSGVSFRDYEDIVQ